MRLRNVRLSRDEKGQDRLIVNFDDGSTWMPKWSEPTKLVYGAYWTELVNMIRHDNRLRTKYKVRLEDKVYEHQPPVSQVSPSVTTLQVVNYLQELPFHLSHPTERNF